MIGRFGAMELVIILAIALLIFGPKKLPEIGKALGKTIKEFKTHTNKIASDEPAEEEARKLPSEDTVKTEESSSANDESKSS